ncbi:MAG: ribonuclease P protein component [Clostridia bacterium]|nr:ribonuclease P protein component [Clostridia bacterium]MBQ9993447.1 ribonuclease P protein component [Clostridia bacterium]
MDKNCIHIKNDYEFRRVYRRGKSFVSPTLVTYCEKRRGSRIRVGITTGKKIGNAVHRNRARRVIREAYRQLAPMASGGWDIVFVARGKTPFVKMQAVKDEMLVHLTNAGVIASLRSQ